MKHRKINYCDGHNETISGKRKEIIRIYRGAIMSGGIITIELLK